MTRKLSANLQFNSTATLAATEITEAKISS